MPLLGSRKDLAYAATPCSNNSLPKLQTASTCKTANLSCPKFQMYCCLCNIVFNHTIIILCVYVFRTFNCFMENKNFTKTSAPIVNTRKSNTFDTIKLFLDFTFSLENIAAYWALTISVCSCDWLNCCPMPAPHSLCSPMYIRT
ncbi:hypothetical protein COCON_G00053140 [Conger conger]|uniref:Uncharacterized protein n=1 Tax=Conger conger TaxID=82655 RepID=A0A9Q1I5S1_CONCO|nr:hypothetical protein COCON_G00053140 [Conger conger]